MSQAKQAEQLAQKVVQQLQNVTDELSIKEITLNAWKPLKESILNPNSFKRPSAAFRKVIEAAFPSTNEPKPGYYKTSTGKKKDERYEHLALWYCTVNEDRWNVVGDAARAEYWNNLLPFPEKPADETLTEEPQATTTQATESEPPTLKLEDMKIDQLELDAETQETVANALEHSGMSLADFIKQACKVYAKTVTGKAKQSTEDLSTIPTNELREGKAYKTHPGRAEELVKRAIQAIALHNGQATEINQKWYITQSLLLEMTGSKIPTIQELIGRKAKDGTVLKSGKYQTNVDDINARLKADYGVDEYLNRKPKEVKENFVEEWVTLVPNGLDDFNSSPMVVSTVNPVSTANPDKITKLPVTTTTLEIVDYLGSHPNESVQIKGDGRALTYERVNDEKGYMKAARIVETGEEIPA